MATRSMWVVVIVGAILLCTGAIGCGGDESEGQTQTTATVSAEELKRKIDALRLGIPISVAKAQMGKADSHQFVESPTFGRTDYFRYSEWQLNFVDGKLHAIWKETNRELNPYKYER